MKKIGSVVLCCLGVTAVGASGALAQNGNSPPNPNQVTSKMCTVELHQIGVKEFKIKYGDPHKSGDESKKQHAMRNCKGKKSNSSQNLVNDAAKQCKAEQADPTFPFDETYGTNHNQQNAFGQCVRTKVHEALAQFETNVENAAQQCRTERSQNPDAFRTKYGTVKSKRKNAFGKCVSEKAKAQGGAPTPTT